MACDSSFLLSWHGSPLMGSSPEIGSFDEVRDLVFSADVSDREMKNCPKGAIPANPVERPSRPAG